MYRPRAYAIDDVAVLHHVIRERSFATIAAVVDGDVQFAYAPMLVDSAPAPYGSVRFHLARGNPLSECDGAPIRIGLLGADAYVSPDWYRTGAFVPTWNYIAVEGAGRARVLDERDLRRLLVDLSAGHEERLRPKPPWTPKKIIPERMEMLIRSIRGFVLPFEALEGKFKLSQDKAPDDIAGVIAGLEARGDPASLAVARAMKESGTVSLRASTGSA
ncbi:MAG TPA: FMN-binding negative transcriptional regulator [Rhizomicrobium sp.]|jgi:transcriptional regulator